jgi:hypothetical protein
MFGENVFALTPLEGQTAPKKVENSIPRRILPCAMSRKIFAKGVFAGTPFGRTNCTEEG